MLYETCKARLYFGVPLGLLGQNMAKCNRGLPLLGSETQTGSFLNLVSDHGGRYFPENTTSGSEKSVE